MKKIILILGLVAIGVLTGCYEQSGGTRPDSTRSGTNVNPALPQASEGIKTNTGTATDTPTR